MWNPYNYSGFKEMKIYQVEELVGITKKNIRFYEEQGLLHPERNPENDYREYSLKDVEILEKIKLLRKLSVPIEEIRLLEKGSLSFSQSMTRQIERIEKEMKNSEVIKQLCSRLKDENAGFKALNASEYLREMKQMEEKGTEFVDIEKKDINMKKKTGAVAAAVFFSILMISVLSTLVYAVIAGKAPLFPVIISGIIIFCVVAGTGVVLVQRIREINGGEEYDARKY